MIGVVYLLSTVVATAVEPLVQIDQPAPVAVAYGLRPSPTPPLPAISPTPEEPTEVPTLARPPATMRPIPTAVPPTPSPAPPAVQPPCCPSPQVAITSPGFGAQVSGMVPIFGSASYPHMSYYKLEYGAGANPNVWSYFDGGENPVQSGRLGSLNTGALPPGTYSIRVIVVDNTGNYPPPCQTTFNVK